MASNTVNFSQLLYPGLAAIWGTSYPDYKPEWSQIFPVKPSSQNYEKTLGMSGFGLAPIKDQGKAIDYDDPFQGPVHSLYHFVRGLGFIVTKEMWTDDQYGKINALPKALKKSMHQSKEWDHANVLNYAFTSSTAYYGADGVCLCSLLHPLLGGGYIANTPATQSDLSLTALEQAVAIDIPAWVDDRGLKVNLMARKLITTTLNDWTAFQLLGADKDPETPASNAPNPAKNLFPEGRLVSHYITDTDSWFILTDCSEGLVSYKHTKWGLQFGKDNDFGSDNGLFKATDRYVAGWDDPRCIYGSSGA